MATALQTDQQDVLTTARREPPQIINPGGPTAANVKAIDFLADNKRASEDTFRVSQSSFEALVMWLRESTSMSGSKYHSLRLKVIIFLYVLSQGCTQRAEAHHFGISQSAVSRVVRSSAKAFEALHLAFVKQPDDEFICPENITKRGRQVFHGCISATDGTHIDAFVPSSTQKK